MKLSEVLAKLREPFPNVQLKPQALNEDGTKALAVAFLDRADVQGRLNDVCPDAWEFRIATNLPDGQGGWACAGTLIVCGESRDDGGCARADDAEPFKAAISDCLKRCATHFGIGEYLYRLPMEWVPCECTTDRNGKLRFKRWTGKPSWLQGGTPAPAPEPYPDEPAATPRQSAPQGDGGNGGGKPTIKDPDAPMTEPQGRMLKRLVHEKCGEGGEANGNFRMLVADLLGIDEAAMAMWSASALTKGQASTLIDNLLQRPALAA